MTCVTTKYSILHLFLLYLFYYLLILFYFILIFYYLKPPTVLFFDFLRHTNRQQNLIIFRVYNQLSIPHFLSFSLSIYHHLLLTASLIPQPWPLASVSRYAFQTAADRLHLPRVQWRSFSCPTCNQYVCSPPRSLYCRFLQHPARLVSDAPRSPQYHVPHCRSSLG